MQDKTYPKVLILAVYDAIMAPVAENEVRESILSTGEIAVFEYEEQWKELVNDGFLALSHDEKKKLNCTISDAGKYLLGEAKQMVPAAKLQRDIDSTIRYFDSIHTGRWYDADFKKADGGYYVICTMESDKHSYMEVKVFFENMDDALTALHTCKERPEVIRSGLDMIMLGGTQRKFV